MMWGTDGSGAGAAWREAVHPSSIPEDTPIVSLR